MNNIDHIPNIHIISDIQQRTLETLLQAETKVNTDEVIKLLNEIYDCNKKIYNQKHDRYSMKFLPIMYLNQRATETWNCQEYLTAIYVDQYTRENICVNVKPAKLQINELKRFEDNIQLVLFLKHNNACHMLLCELPITDMFASYYHPDTRSNCNNQACLKNSNCKCKWHETDWCNTCHAEEYKTEFLHKRMVHMHCGYIYPDYTIPRSNIFGCMNTYKKITLTLLKNVEQFSEKTTEVYYHHFMNELRAKAKSLKHEYALAKSFLETWDKHSQEVSSEVLTNEMDAYKYFRELDRDD